MKRANEPASRLRTQGTEQRPRPVDETGSAEVVPQHNEISRRKRGAIELMLQTDVEKEQKNTLVRVCFLCFNTGRLAEILN
jgi:hypothetical protein